MIIYLQRTPYIQYESSSSENSQLFRLKTHLFERALAKKNFTIITDPNTDEVRALVSVELPDTTSIGEKTVTATLGSSSATCTVKVSDKWIPVANVPLPTIDGEVHGTSTDYGTTGIIDVDLWMVETESAGEYSWDEIASGAFDANDSFSTTKSTAWTAGTSVTGEIEFGLPWAGTGGKVAVTGSFSWEEAEDHSLTTNGGDPEYTYKASHHQGLCSITLIHRKYWKDEPGDPFISKGAYTTSGGTNGAQKYCQQKWKKAKQ